MNLSRKSSIFVLVMHNYLGTERPEYTPEYIIPFLFSKPTSSMDDNRATFIMIQNNFRIVSSSYRTQKVHDGWEEGVVRIVFIDSGGRQRMHVRHTKIGNGAHDTVMGDCYTPEDCIRWSIRWIQTHEVDTLTDPFLVKYF